MDRNAIAKSCLVRDGRQGGCQECDKVCQSVSKCDKVRQSVTKCHPGVILKVKSGKVREGHGRSYPNTRCVNNVRKVTGEWVGGL